MNIHLAPGYYVFGERTEIIIIAMTVLQGGFYLFGILAFVKYLTR